MKGMDDQVSLNLLDFMASYDYKAPAGWTGTREVDI
jgi:hypothetical protein